MAGCCSSGRAAAAVAGARLDRRRLPATPSAPSTPSAPADGPTRPRPGKPPGDRRGARGRAAAAVGRTAGAAARPAARSQTSLGSGLLALLSRDQLDEETWEEIEEALITADVGVGPPGDRRRPKTRSRCSAPAPGRVARAARTELVTQLGAGPHAGTAPHGGTPAVVLMVGVNGTGKTTTVRQAGPRAVADGQTVLLGAADTFRAAAADQLRPGARGSAPRRCGPPDGRPGQCGVRRGQRGHRTASTR